MMVNAYLGQGAVVGAGGVRVGRRTGRERIIAQWSGTHERGKRERASEGRGRARRAQHGGEANEWVACTRAHSLHPARAHAPRPPPHPHRPRSHLLTDTVKKQRAAWTALITLFFSLALPLFRGGRHQPKTRGKQTRATPRGDGSPPCLAHQPTGSQPVEQGVGDGWGWRGGRCRHTKKGPRGVGSARASCFLLFLFFALSARSLRASIQKKD